MNFSQKEFYKFEDLLKIMEILRSEEGCMWDKEQNHKSIRKNFIEETYEVCEAIDNDDTDLLKEELGDVMLQVVFHTQMEKEKGAFNIDDVADGICKKLIYRHPHIFQDTIVHSSDEILKNWDALKRVEKGQKSTTDSLVSVSKALPGLMRAEKIQAKAAKVGFDWDNVSGALSKVHEEIAELESAISGDGTPEEELGDLMFAVVNVARFLKIDAEHAIEKTCDKFIDRFKYIEKSSALQGKKLEQMSLTKMDDLWNEKKALERNAEND